MTPTNQNASRVPTLRTGGLVASRDAPVLRFPYSAWLESSRVGDTSFAPWRCANGQGWNLSTHQVSIRPSQAASVAQKVRQRPRESGPFPSGTSPGSTAALQMQPRLHRIEVLTERGPLAVVGPEPGAFLWLGGHQQWPGIAGRLRADNEGMTAARAGAALGQQLRGGLDAGAAAGAAERQSGSHEASSQGGMMNRRG